MDVSQDSYSPPVSLADRDRPPLRNSFRQVHRLMETGASVDAVSEMERKASRNNSEPRSTSPSGIRIATSPDPRPLTFSPEQRTPSPEAAIHDNRPQTLWTSQTTQFGVPKLPDPMTKTFSQADSMESGKSITFYPSYLRTIGGMFRILEIIIAIIICATADSTQCLAHAVCGPASSSMWHGLMGGQGFVLFVAIIFIFGNLALIVFRVLKRPLPIPKLAIRAQMAELLYNGAAAVMFIIAACVEAYYASWVTVNITPNENYFLMANQIVPNTFRPQWIAAAIFCWLQAVIYVGNALYIRVYEADEDDGDRRVETPI